MNLNKCDKMYSNKLEFLEFLNWLVNLNNEKYYEDITSVSSSKGENPKSLVESDVQILNIEQIMLEKYGENNTPAIVDGIYFNFNKKNKLCLFFIEFKGDKLDKKPLKEYYKNNICTIKESTCGIQILDCPNKHLNQSKIRKIYEHYEDEMTVQLKLKPLETILIAIPTLFREYKKISDTSNALLRDYFNCNIYVVYANDINSSNTHLTIKQEIEDKYASYQKNGIITLYKVMPNDDFADNFIPKINLFPIHFLNYILNIVNYLKENPIEKNDFDNEIDSLIELEFEDENITPNQKKKLHKIIYSLC